MNDNDRPRGLVIERDLIEVGRAGLWCAYLPGPTHYYIDGVEVTKEVADEYIARNRPSPPTGG